MTGPWIYLTVAGWVLLALAIVMAKATASELERLRREFREYRTDHEIKHHRSETKRPPIKADSMLGSPEPIAGEPLPDEIPDDYAPGMLCTCDHRFDMHRFQLSCTARFCQCKTFVSSGRIELRDIGGSAPPSARCAKCGHRYGHHQLHGGGHDEGCEYCDCPTFASPEAAAPSPHPWGLPR